MLRKSFFLFVLTIFFVACMGGGSSDKDLVSDIYAMHSAAFALEYASNTDYNNLSKLKLNDEKLAGPAYESMMRLKKMSMDMRMYIQDMESLLVAESENIDKRFADTLNYSRLKNPDDDIATGKIMFSEGKVKDLILKLNQFEAETKLIATGQQPFAYFHAERFNEEENFKGKSLIRVLLLLESIKLEVRTSESLLAKNTVADLLEKFDQQRLDSVQ